MTVFISYAKEDEHRANEVYDLLHRNRFRTWIAKKDIPPGRNWKAEIRKAIRQADVFLACLSTVSVSKRGYVQAELKEALEVLKTVPEDKTFIIPVRLDDCRVPTSLQEIQRVDFFAPDGPQRLADGVRLCIAPSEGQASPFSATLRPPSGERVPTIAVDIAGGSGRFVRVVGKMDTGATMTVLTFDAARALGIQDPTRSAAGVIHLASATGHRMACFRHHVMVRIPSDDGDVLTFVLLVAFAEDVRGNLFGMDWVPHLSVTVDEDGVRLSRYA